MTSVYCFLAKGNETYFIDVKMFLFPRRQVPVSVSGSRSILQAALIAAFASSSHNFIQCFLVFEHRYRCACVHELA